MNWLGCFDKVERKAESVANAISGAAVVCMILVISLYIVLRQFKIGLLFVEEWSGYLVVLVGFLSLTYALRQGAHIVIDIVINKLPVSAQRALALVTSIITLALVVWISLQSYIFAIEAMKTGQTSLYVTHTPLWLPRLFVPIGFSLFSIALALDLVRKIEALVKSNKV